MASRITTKDNDIAGYVAIAVACGMSVAEAWPMVVDLDRNNFHTGGSALAVDVEKAAKQRTGRE